MVGLSVCLLLKEKEMNRNDLKKTLELNETIFVDKFAVILQPYAKVIYLVGLVLLAFWVLGSLGTLLTGSISKAIVLLIFSGIEFILLRMFCEFLISYKK